ncbi:MAG TPA: OmpA family protein [Thermoguttaceae bacterium]|nr:OmpA family protein [Thermoguttaceae bacterium]
MRRSASARRSLALALVIMALTAVIGCGNSSMVLQGRVRDLTNQQVALTGQNQQLQARLSALDKAHQEQVSQLALTRQENKVIQDTLAATRDQLRGAKTQLEEVRTEKQSADNQVEALTASMRRRGGVMITPNNSLLQTPPAINLPGVYVRRDGNRVRVELPGGQLFESGSARLLPGAPSLITAAATELLAVYPDQTVGVEGHTDSDPITGRALGSNHELSLERAKAVFDLLVGQTRFEPRQLFIIGHGPNDPVASNATLEGKQRNRRVELVVYPEQSG